MLDPLGLRSGSENCRTEEGGAVPNPNKESTIRKKGKKINKGIFAISVKRGRVAGKSLRTVRSSNVQESS